jgi:hypothetical protein
MIRATGLALAAVIVPISILSSQTAAAREAPWCAVIATTDDSVTWDCQYFSFEQCRSVVLAGNRGWCNPSPYATAGAAEPKRKPRKGHSS